MRRRMLISVIIVVVVVLFFGGWAMTYPSSSDPKNMKYVLWKAGLYKVSLDQATTAMVGDRNRDELVVGKTKAQLRDKFGPLVSSAEASSVPQRLLSELVLEGQRRALHRAEFMDGGFRWRQGHKPSADQGVLGSRS